MIPTKSKSYADGNFEKGKVSFIPLTNNSSITLTE